MMNAQHYFFFTTGFWSGRPALAGGGTGLFDAPA
jgi:hypothetical protein